MKLNNNTLAKEESAIEFQKLVLLKSLNLRSYFTKIVIGIGTEVINWIYQATGSPVLCH